MSIPKRWQNYEQEIREVFFNHRSIIKYERRLRQDSTEINFDDTLLEKSYSDFWKFASKIDVLLDHPKKIVEIEDKCNLILQWRQMPTKLVDDQLKQILFLIENYLRLGF